MEKYKRFTDPATGINPFVPAVRPASSWRVGLACVLTPISLLLVAVFYLCYLLLGAVPFAILGGLAAPLHAVAVTIFGRLSLLLLAGAKVNRGAYPPRPSNLSRQSDEVNAPAAGDVLFVNCQSPLDALALQCAFPSRPMTFVYPRVTASPQELPDSRALRVLRSVPAAMVAALTLTDAADNFEVEPGTTPPSLRPVDLAPAQSQAKRQGRVLAVFAEGATTNGRGVLRLAPVACGGGSGLHVAGVAYGNPAHTAPVTANPSSGIVQWLVHECAAASLRSLATVDVAAVRPSHRPPVPSTFSTEWATTLQTKLGQAVSFNRSTDQPCRPLASTAFDKQRFLCQWLFYNAATNNKK
jgi:1-acyl-sn-glycerol-3-phosphate acyltransferase